MKPSEQLTSFFPLRLFLVLDTNSEIFPIVGKEKDERSWEMNIFNAPNNLISQKALTVSSYKSCNLQVFEQVCHFIP